eukprot:g16591.t1
MASMDLSGALCADSTRRAASTLEKAAAQSLERSWACWLSVALPELGWSVCEPLFMPLLLELEVPKSLIAICWVISPSDPCDSKGYTHMFNHASQCSLAPSSFRRPFILVFSTTAVLGLVATPLIALLPVKALAILAFGMADPSEVMSIVWSLAKLHCASEMCEAVSFCISDDGLHELTSRSFSNLLWAVAHMQMTDLISTPEVIVATASRISPVCKPQEVSLARFTTLVKENRGTGPNAFAKAAAQMVWRTCYARIMREQMASLAVLQEVPASPRSPMSPMSPRSPSSRQPDGPRLPFLQSGEAIEFLGRVKFVEDQLGARMRIRRQRAAAREREERI